MAGERQKDFALQDKKAKRAQARVRENQSRRAQREAQAMQKWAVMRQTGIRNYVIKNGLIIWTLMTSVIYIIMLGVTLKFQFTSEVWQQIAAAVFFFAVGGVLFGFATWYLSETRYQRYLANKDQQKKSKKGK